ncbi:MAG: DUF3604 domain-containing protein [Deltaproteobacteria bacterium]|nr:DUF3604 domain-containing protein [Deltaproteobacteria bacterium]MBW2419219.1 DUF3604 domain-containing protein [Deltaproteobacteria bacterium]
MPRRTLRRAATSTRIQLFEVSFAAELRVLVCGLLLFSTLPVGAEEQLLWGDTHVHTSYSTDSYIGQNFTAGPDTAYRYAKGLPVIHPTTGARIRIETPLDFLVVADHAESFGAMKWANEEGLPRQGLGPIDWLHSWLVEKLFRVLADNPGSVVQLLEFASPDTDVVVEAARTPAGITIPNVDEVIRSSWAATTNAADTHNEPARFSALIGWEWSAVPAGANLHRVVFTSSDAGIAQQFIPFSSSTSSYPEDLWRWLDETASDTGADFVAIPHNSNISRGYMFPADKRLRDTPIDRDWIDLRAKWETVVEATQIKGDSETDPAVSPDDEFADFEAYPHYISPKPIPFDPGPGDFVRSALGRGLAIEARFGANPYQFGLIGSTDSHTGLPTAEEPNFWGKFASDSIPRDKARNSTSIENFGWVISASGLAGVWAEENTRDAIFRAFKRREVYATTGPRIRVRVLAGTGFGPGDEKKVELAGVREAGVPMGGELRSLEEPPSFLIRAAKDPKSAHLDRIQMVKGWLAAGESFERVYDVVGSGARVPGSDGRLPRVPDTVDSATGEYSNEHGAATLAALWTDPDFDSAQPAFYYVRVLEIPTPRHSTLDALALGIAPEETGQPISIQERAYTSPIHYRP